MGMDTGSAAYNLIEERWIPVRRRSGRVDHVAPWQIADQDDPPVCPETARPDFDAAVLEMLIGLLQTVAMPPDENEWRTIYQRGMDPRELRDRMRTVRDAFHLDGDGPRFFQDLDVDRHPEVKRRSVGSLLIERCTASGTSLFAKERESHQFGMPMAAMALLTLQVFAPIGGKGHRTSLRGGGPISTTIRDATLFRTCWCNVLSQEDFGMIPGDTSKAVFPWMARTRTSEREGSGTGPSDVHPLQHYWGLPRRIRLCFDDLRDGTCDLCGQKGPIVTEMWSRMHGTSYKGPFRHPLTAYTIHKQLEWPNPKKGGSSISYRDWPLLHLGGDGQIPPAVVQVFYERERWTVAKAHRLCASGYAMDNTKSLQFYEAEMPILHVPRSVTRSLRGHAAELVNASQKVRTSLANQVKSAWTDRPKNLPGDASARTDAAFLASTETHFYDTLKAVAAAIERKCDDAIIQAKTQYVRNLRWRALEVFDSLCPVDDSLGTEGLRRTVQARRSLGYFSSAKVLASVVGIAPDDASPSVLDVKESD